MSFVWSQAAVRLLHGFYVEQGLSAGQTAAALGRELGDAPTRNAVLGKAQRMGWTKPAAEPACPPPPPSVAKVRHGPTRWPRPLADRPLPPLREAPTQAAPKLWTERRRFECAYRLPPFIALNEPEASLHPDLMEPLAGMVVNAAKRSQVWLVTHSERLAQAVNAAGGAMVRTVVKTDGATTIEGLKAWGEFEDEADEDV